MVPPEGNGARLGNERDRSTAKRAFAWRPGTDGHFSKTRRKEVRDEAAYNPERLESAAAELAGKIVALVLASGVTYGQADAALAEAQSRLYTETKSVSAGILPQRDCESKPEQLNHSISRSRK